MNSASDAGAYGGSGVLHLREMFSRLRMANNSYLILYPNGIKRHISRAELATLSGLVQIGPKEYKASSLETNLAESTGPDYLSGAFIIERDGQREHERLQTSKGQLAQLKSRGWEATQI